MDKSSVYELAKDTKQYRLLIKFGLQDTTTDKMRRNGTYQFRSELLQTTFRVRTAAKGSLGLGYVDKRLDTALNIRRSGTHKTIRGGKKGYAPDQNMPTKIATAKGRFKTVNEIASAFNYIRFHYSDNAKTMIKSIFKTKKWRPNRMMIGAKGPSRKGREIG